MAEHPAHDPLVPEHLFGHVKDSTHFVFPWGEVKIPQPFAGTKPLISENPAAHLQAVNFQLTKFMVLEAAAALIIAIFFIAVARRISSGDRPRGRFLNLLEAMLVYMRDEVARPAIGMHDADRFLPFVWTMFFFVLGCNLLGMFPWAGSPTASLATTLSLALITFATVVGMGTIKSGPVGFWTSLVPHMELPLPLMLMLWPLIFVLEVVSLMIKHFVLAVRLLANILAGHLVLAVIVAFIVAAANHALWPGVAAASVLGAATLSLLELFVAFLQAFVFTFLAALFIGSAVHPH